MYYTDKEGGRPPLQGGKNTTIPIYCCSNTLPESAEQKDDKTINEHADGYQAVNPSNSHHAATGDERLEKEPSAAVFL